MRSILLKDYLEQRMYFLIILAVAVVSLLAAAYFKQLDSGTAIVLLFVLQGPLFVYLAANHQISSEVNNRTFPFLLTLPISRARLWFSKLLFVFVYALLLYAFYIVLAIICGASLFEFYKLFSISPVMGFGLPLLLMSYGYFTSMLPRGFATIASLIIGPVVFAVAINPLSVATLNYTFAAIFLSTMFLALSAFIFMNDRTMSSKWRGVKGIALLVLGIGLLLVCWTSLSAAADYFWTIDEDGGTYKWVPVNDGRQILWRADCKSHWWDVVDIDRYYSHRVFLQDLKTNEVKAIASRMSSFGTYNGKFNSGFAGISASKYSFGFLRSFEYTVIDHEGKPVMVLPAKTGGFLKYFCLIDDKRFIYAEDIKTGQSVITEFSLYEKDRGTKVVFSAQKGFAFHQYVIMPAKEAGKAANVYISAESDRENGRMMLISVADGSRYELPIKSGSRSVAVASDYIVYEEKVWNRKRKDYDRTLVQAWLDGRTERLDWLADELEVVTIMASGRLLALKLAPGEKMRFMEYKQSLVEIDLTTKMVKEIYRFPEPSSVTMKVTQNRDKALMYFNTSDLEPMICKFMSVDLLSGQMREFDRLNKAGHDHSRRVGLALEAAYHLSGNRFMVEAGRTIYELDVASMQVDERTDFYSMVAGQLKGGARR